MSRISISLVLLSLVTCAAAQTPVSNSVGQDSANVVQQDQSQPAQPVQPAPDQSVSPGNAPMIRLGPGDLLEMKVFDVPEMTQESRINGEGDLTVTLVGPVHLQGLSSTQAEQLIEAKLRDGGYLKDPHVSIFVKEYVTQGISVMGEVQHPGIYPMLGARRLFDALSSAGGTTSKAGNLVTITRRDDPQHPVTVVMSPDPAKSAETNVDIQPGDTIVVSKAGVVYVVGAVERPGGFIMDNNEKLTVLQAVALAYGAKPTASLDKSKIIRKNKEGVQEVPVALNKILEGKAADVALSNDDILFVPASAAKGAFRRTAEAAIQAATGVAIYRR